MGIFIYQDRVERRACGRQRILFHEPQQTLEFQMNRSAAASLFPRLLRRAAFALLAVMLFSAVAAHAESAKSFYKRGIAAEAREDYDAAYTAYQKAYQLAPQDVSYKSSYYRLRGQASSVHMAAGRRLLQTGDEQGALTELLHAAEIDPSNEAAQQEITRIRSQHQAVAVANPDEGPSPGGDAAQIAGIASPVTLRPISMEPLTLHMVEDAKVVYQAVGKAAGINVLFDPDYSPKRIQVDLNAVTLYDALRIVGTLSNTFWRPVTANTIFVAANTSAKRRELDEMAVQTFYLTNAWQQNDLNDVNTALRNVLTSPNFKAYAVASQNAIVARGTPDELLLAQKIVDDLDRARPEVVVDIAVLEVSKNWERKLGLSWPQSAGVSITGGTSSSSSSSSSTSTTSTTTPTLYTLSHLNSSNFQITLDTATANMLLTDSDTKILQNPRIRATDAQKATMKIGSRNPIATGSYTSTAASTSGLAETQFQYIDVGVNIEMTPTVHYNHDVTMKLSIEVSSISNYVTISNVQEPVIAQKKSEQTIRLREGEASVLGGILNRQDIQSWSGLPGLSSIPLFKYLFGSKDHQTTDDEIVFLLVPHVVRSPYLTPTNLRPIDIGSGQSIELRQRSEVPAVPAVARPRPVVEPKLGTVPGSSAAGGAPAALAQMRASADAPPLAPPAAAAPAPVAASGPNAPGSHLGFAMIPSSNPVANGATFQIPIVITSAENVASVPLQIDYDAAKLSLVNVGEGDFLSRDGQPVTLVHRDDGPGSIVINASRPPGSVGVSGAGVVCVLSFQTKAPGETSIRIAHPTALTAAQQPVQAQSAQATIVVK
jgi:general secretion pathway protein D